MEQLKLPYKPFPLQRSMKPSPVKNFSPQEADVEISGCETSGLDFGIWKPRQAANARLWRCFLLPVNFAVISSVHRLESASRVWSPARL